MRCLIRFVMGCAWLLSMTLVYAGAPPQIWVALSEMGGAYTETAAALQAELLQEAKLTVDSWQNLLDEQVAPPALIVTVGAGAFENTLKWLAVRDDRWNHVPVLATLLPQTTYEKQLVGAGAQQRAISAAVLDQPLTRQLALLKRALPERKRVGLLLGPQSRSLLGVLEKAARVQEMQLVLAPEISAPSALYSALKTVLDTADVILALPDPMVYNSSTTQNILLTTYRARVPLVAFSAAYVKAGAVLAVYSTPAQVARRAATMVRAWQAGGGLPAPQMSREFMVAANARVATSLGLQLDEVADIAADLYRQEGRR